MEPTALKRRIADAVVARIATVSAEGTPHLVPITFAIEDDTLYFAVDIKPKRTTELQRLKNIAANPRVCVLVDHYEDDWTKLWWVRVDGTARIVGDGSEAEHAVDLLVGRYAQYRHARPGGPVVAIAIDRISGWSAA
jgi:PPOX class probable F420-dependent enzyme